MNQEGREGNCWTEESRTSVESMSKIVESTDQEGMTAKKKTKGICNRMRMKEGERQFLNNFLNEVFGKSRMR